MRSDSNAPVRTPHVGLVSGLPSAVRPLPSVLCLAVLCLLSSVVCLTGCAGYRLGTGSEPKFHTLFVAPVASEALIPQARVLVTSQIREALIRDGRVALVNSVDQAEAVLTVTLSTYERSVAVSRTEDTGLARRFDVTLSAKATLVDNRTKEAYFTNRSLEAKRGVFTDSGLVPSEYEALPLLAEQLANETVHAVLDTW